MNARALLIFCIALIAVAIWWVPQWLSFAQLASHYQALKTLIDAYPFTAWALFFTLYMSVVALSIPVALVLTLGGAALFGWVALPLIILAASLGATLVFLLAKTVFRATLQSRVASWLAGVESAFQESPVRWCLTMRFIPVMPFWAANIIPAVLGMRIAPFFLSTLVGILPGTAIYVGIGRGLDHIFQRGTVPDLTVLQAPSVWAPLLALGLLSALSTRFRRRQHATSEG